MVFHLVVTLLYLTTCAHAAVKLSDFVSPCSIRDAKINECLETQGRALLPHLVAGVKDWNVPPIDPLFVPHMSVQQGSGSGGLSFNITDVYHRGFKDCTFSRFKIDTKTYEINVHMHCLTYNVKGNYEVAGQIILLPIKGNGLADITFKHLDSQIKLTSEPETRGKETYLKVTQTTCDDSVKGIVFNLENLFGNKALSDNMNAVLTENGVEVFKDLKVPLDNAFGDIIHQIVHRIFKKVPLKQLFKDV